MLNFSWVWDTGLLGLSNLAQLLIIAKSMSFREVNVLLQLTPW